MSEKWERDGNTVFCGAVAIATPYGDPDESLAIAQQLLREHNAHASLVEALDPDALEAIADELAPFDKGGARIHSLRVIAKAQRTALALAEEE